MSEQIAANKRKTFILMFGFVLLLSIVGVAIVLPAGAGLIGLVIVAVLVIAAAVALYSTSDKVTLATAHAKPADEHQYARLYNLVEGLCIASGLPAPQLYIIEDDVAERLLHRP